MAKRGRSRSEMERVYEIIDRRIEEGVLSTVQIAEEAGCSIPTVVNRSRIPFEVPSEEPVYRGGGEW